MISLMLACVPVWGAEWQARYTQILFQARDQAAVPMWNDLNRIRLDWQEWRGAWSWQLSYDHEWLWGGLVRNPLFKAAALSPEATWVDASDMLHVSGSLLWRHRLYRGWLRYDRGDFALTVGRQRVAWGSGRIWNPTDRFNPVSPTAIEPDQKLGVDALDMQWRYSAYGGFEWVWAPGRHRVGNRKKWAVRWSDTFGESDLALLVGKIGGERVAGMDLTGNWSDAGYRVEWLQSWLHGRFGQVSAGLDYTWSNRWFPAGLYTAIEYFYNGAVFQAAAVDRLQSRAKHLLGLMFGYDISPLWRLEGNVLVDPQFGSLFLAPRLQWSVRQNLDAMLIVQWTFGGQADEYHASQRIVAAQIDWYFDL